MIYFTSDQHFGHFNIIRLCGRPFKSLEEMDATLLERWNAKVKPGDTVYILGDLFFRSAQVEPVLKALNGRKHLIVGNHDHTWMGKVKVDDYFESIQTIKEVVVDGRIMTLCHYPMLSYPQARRGWMAYGHIHNNIRDDYWPLIVRRSRLLNVGVDVNNFEPVSFDEMVANNRSFIASHVDDAKINPFDLNCIEA
ncbi:MAG: metallophosphoesterase [Kiritimatiellae bacterium]|nr:metallophosphoesterase [Kiritimatiellia bacterium]